MYSINNMNDISRIKMYVHVSHESKTEFHTIEMESRV